MFTSKLASRVNGATQNMFLFAEFILVLSQTWPLAIIMSSTILRGQTALKVAIAADYAMFRQSGEFSSTCNKASHNYIKPFYPCIFYAFHFTHR